MKDLFNVIGLLSFPAVLFGISNSASGLQFDNGCFVVSLLLQTDLFVDRY